MNDFAARLLEANWIIAQSACGQMPEDNLNWQKVVDSMATLCDKNSKGERISAEDQTPIGDYAELLVNRALRATVLDGAGQTRHVCRRALDQINWLWWAHRTGMRHSPAETDQLRREFGRLAHDAAICCPEALHQAARALDGVTDREWAVVKTLLDDGRSYEDALTVARLIDGEMPNTQPHAQLAT